MILTSLLKPPCVKSPLVHSKLHSRVHFDLTTIKRQVSMQAANSQPPVDQANDQGKKEWVKNPRRTAVDGIVKRKVAMHVGYVGTGYHGLQFSQQPGISTIEEELLTALHAAGLISDDNKGSLTKVKWTRSSRTDKGVHSLSTVVSLKVELKEGDTDADPEGIALADSISAYLPEKVQIFNVQRVNKNFRARQYCQERTYQYFVPAFLLTGSHDTADTEEEREALARFRAALQLYTGCHAFHNFTKMSQYKKAKNDSWRGGRKRRTGSDGESPRKRSKARNEDRDESEDGVSDTESIDLPVSLENGQDNGQKGRVPRERSGERATNRGVFGRLSDEELQTRRWRFWEFEFKDETDEDAVEAAHYRTIKSFTAADPETLSPGGVRAVLCEVQGVSFMIHQIRYMIAAAVSVARGYISLPVLDASLRASIRINFPLGPPHPLVLASSEFRGFPWESKAAPAHVSKWSGERLAVREKAEERRQQFREKVLLPAISDLLLLPEWQLWSDNLDLFTYTESDPQVKQVMEVYADWVERMKVVRELRDREKNEKDQRQTRKNGRREVRSRSVQIVEPKKKNKHNVGYAPWVGIVVILCGAMLARYYGLFKFNQTQPSQPPTATSQSIQGLSKDAPGSTSRR